VTGCTLREEQGSEVERLSSGSLLAKRRERHESSRPREGCGLPGVGKALKVETQERYRGEINPEGIAGCKPSRA